MSIKRYSVLDNIRGIALLNMIIYHAVWDMVYIFNFDWKWYQSDMAYIWQQSICWTFIFLSGFCQSLGRRKLKRGINVFLMGLLISIVTTLVIPQNRILFGVLTLIGSCMLLLLPADKILKRCRPLVGLTVSIALFVITKNVKNGYLGFGSWNIYKLPNGWYHNLATTYLGFPMPGFYSSDYFPLFPWMFLFIAGYFLYQFLHRRELLSYLKPDGIKAMEWLGQHSLIVYVVHQPLLYLILSIVF